MRKQLFFLAVILTGLVACKSNSKSAFNYSESVVAVDKSMGLDVQATEAKVAEYIAADHYDSVAVAGENMEKIVQQDIDKIDALGVPAAKGSAEFKEAIMHYFQFVKSMYAGYVKLGTAPTQEEREQVLNDLREMIAKKTTVLSDMQTAQKKFADANGFKVQ